MRLGPDCQVFADVNGAGHVYANRHTEGDEGRAVRQVPHDQLMRNAFGGEGDVADLLQLFAHMEMDEINCIRLVAARLQQTELDDKTITWGASGKHVCGKNVLPGAATERRYIVLVDDLTVIHPQSYLQHERTINLDPDNKTATSCAFVKFRNNMLHDHKMGGFSLLNHNVPTLLLEDAAFHKLSKMSTIGPWINAQSVLQWDYVTGMGFKGACSVRNGNLGNQCSATRATLIKREGYMVNYKGVQCSTEYKNLGDTSKDAHIKREGYMVNNKGVRCITRYKNLGDLDGATTKATLIKRKGYMVNDKGKRCIIGYHNLGDLGGAASKDTLIKSEGYIINDKGKLCITGYHNLG